MKPLFLSLRLAFLLLISFTLTRAFAGDGKIYTYQSAENDPLNARIYTLANGLKVYLTVFKDAPRIQTYIAVGAGSKNDPSDATGLAHYLEHMVFKGTDKLATSNWELEKAELLKIEDLYEVHRNTTDPAERKRVYAQIDSISGVAAQYAIANEYDKLIASLGAKGTNAYTWLEQTVYINDIPSNSLEKWLAIENERFRTLVLRLFHTELEAVYEEYNRGLDSDENKVFEALFEELFKKNTYGTQTTIGKGEHLKNPSMKKIHEFFNTYYVPNNIAICLSGDLDPDSTIVLIDKYFGSWQSKPVPAYTPAQEEPITAPRIREVLGNESENITLGYRLPGAGTRDALLLKLASGILYNNRAGLIDLNLVQKQEVLSAVSEPIVFKDYSVHYISADPKEGQSLDEVKNLLLQQIEKLKKGEFEDWLIQAVVNDYKLQKMKNMESNGRRADMLVEAFITGQNWSDFIMDVEEMSKFSKADVIKFANDYYGENYVAVYKRTGTDTAIQKVEKPQITPVSVNRDAESAFATEFSMLSASATATPVFLDYRKDISNFALKNGTKYSYIENKYNNTFNLYYIFDMGTNHDRKLGVALSYLPYLGAGKLTAAQLQQEFYKLGVYMDVNTSEDQCIIQLRGLESSLAPGIELLETLLSKPKADKAALDELVAGILKQREDAKLNKNQILFAALVDYATYGKTSPFKNILSEAELKALTPEELITIIKDLRNYQHRVFYYGKNRPGIAIDILNELHKVPKEPKPYPAAKVFAQQPTPRNIVYFVNYDMVQAEIILLARSQTFNRNMTPLIRLYNEYFGSGLSSIVFQEIRESKALAYSTFAEYTSPDYANENHYMMAYVGTQADKFPEATLALKNLLNEMPLAEPQFEAAKNAVLRKIESERITRTNIFFNYESARKKGLDIDLRRDIYTKGKMITLADLAKFQKDMVKNKTYTHLVIASKDKIDMEQLRSMGEVKELTLQEIFGY